MSTAKTAEELKELGNIAFAAKDYDVAIAHYSDAIKLDRYNHVFYSNRSASYGGKGDWEAAAADAKECIKLDPTFVKGYYRLATAQIEMKDWTGAEATIKQGLGVDGNNPQLQKQMRIVKQRQRAEANAAAAATTTTTRPTTKTTLDASSSKELSELQQQYVHTTREYNTVKADIAVAQREYKTDEITRTELEKFPVETSSKMYRGIGKMFLLSSRDNVMDHLNKNMEAEKKREQDLTHKLDYLERRIKSQRNNMEELIRSSSSSAAE